MPNSTPNSTDLTAPDPELEAFLAKRQAARGGAPGGYDRNTVIAGIRESTLPGDPDKPLLQSLGAESLRQLGHPANLIMPGVGPAAIDTAMGSASELGKTWDALRAQTQDSINSGKKAWEAAKKGNFREAAGHILDAYPIEAAAHLGRAIPIAGPLVSTVATNIGAGDTKRAIGNGVGLAAQYLAGKLGGKSNATATDVGPAVGDVQSRIGPVVEPPPDTTASSPQPQPQPQYDPRIQYGQPAPTKMGRFLENTAGGKPVFDAARAADLEQKRNIAATRNEADYASQVDQHRADAATTIESLQSNIDRATPQADPGATRAENGLNTGISIAARKAHAQAQFRQFDLEAEPYQRTDPDTGAVEGPVALKNYPQAAAAAARELETKAVSYWTTDAEGNQILAQDQTKLGKAVTSTLSKAVNVQGKATLTQAMNLQSELGQEIREAVGPDGTIPPPLARILTQLREGVGADIDRTLNRMAKDRTIDPATIAGLREARDTWTDLHHPLVEKLNDLGAKTGDPDNVHQELWNRKWSVPDIEVARRVLSPAVYDTLVNHTLADNVMHHFVRNETFIPDQNSTLAAKRSSFDQLTGSRANDLIDAMQGKDNPKDMAKLRLFMGPELMENTIGVARQAAERNPPRFNTELPGDVKLQQTALGMIIHAATGTAPLTGGVVGATRAGVGGGFKGVAVGIGSVALEYALAKAVVKPNLRAQWGRLAVATTKGDMLQASALASALAPTVRAYAREYEDAQAQRKGKGAGSTAASSSTPDLQPPP